MSWYLGHTSPLLSLHVASLFHPSVGGGRWGEGHMCLLQQKLWISFQHFVSPSASITTASRAFMSFGAQCKSTFWNAFLIVTFIPSFNFSLNTLAGHFRVQNLITCCCIVHCTCNLQSWLILKIYIFISVYYLILKTGLFLLHLLNLLSYPSLTIATVYWLKIKQLCWRFKRKNLEALCVPYFLS